jgi:demethylmenaquinone methyltransferase/2-methoxy-6-polyprenyl-1,4-benzoquinol methylase
MSGDFTRVDEVRDVYRRRARHYDISANLYYLLGFREWAYRRRAVDALQLEAGATVVEIGCGTGLNFNLLQQRIGPEGRIIGVDLTDAMLEQARQRCVERGWRNVELVQSSAADYEFPSGIDGVLSTFALTLEPNYEAVIASGARALKQDGRWVVADLRVPDNWLAHLAPLLVFLVRPFAVSMAITRRHPWEAMQRQLDGFHYGERYFGAVYIASGKPRGTPEKLHG